MAYIPFQSSDIVSVPNECLQSQSHCSDSIKNTDYTNEWVKAIEDEISRGTAIRKAKIQSLPNCVRRVNVELAKPCPVSQHRKRGRARAREHSSNHTLRCTSPYPYISPARTCQPTCRQQSASTIAVAKKQRNCSLRIAQLATPTKRQCMDTWRNKSHNLPEIMVERLKKHVMDQRPIVELPDAIQCFKNCKNKAEKKSSKRKSAKLEPKRLLDIRCFCTLFSIKVAQKLIKPRNIQFNQEFERISNVVAQEISDLLKDRYRDTDIALYNKINNEIAKQITVWIAAVLETTSYKLLEEDLRELEEEEGPVLDFIDQLLDNVEIMCSPDEVFCVETIESEETFEQEGQTSRTEPQMDTIIDNTDELNQNDISIASDIVADKLSKRSYLETNLKNKDIPTDIMVEENDDSKGEIASSLDNSSNTEDISDNSAIVSKEDHLIDNQKEAILLLVDDVITSSLAKVEKNTNEHTGNKDELPIKSINVGESSEEEHFENANEAPELEEDETN